MSKRFVLMLCALGLVVGLGEAWAEEKAEPSTDIKKIQGVWNVWSREVAGEKMPDEVAREVHVTIKDNTFMVKRGDEVIQAGTFKLDFAKKPIWMDADVTEGELKGGKLIGILEQNGDDMRICYCLEGKARPTEFKSKAGTSHTMNVYKRVKK